MNGMVERVARAICRVGGDNPDMMVWPYHVPMWQMLANEARAAIAAMREPTMAMANAPYERADEIPKTDPPCYLIAYQKMIDAALADEPNSPLIQPSTPGSHR